MTASKGLFPIVERVGVDPVAIAAFTREWDFMVLESELLREVTSYVSVAACTLGPAPAWTRDQAAVGGNMVRLKFSSYQITGPTNFPKIRRT